MDGRAARARRVACSRVASRRLQPRRSSAQRVHSTVRSERTVQVGTKPNSSERMVYSNCHTVTVTVTVPVGNCILVVQARMVVGVVRSASPGFFADYIYA